MAHTPGPWSTFFYVRNHRLKLGDWSFIQNDGHRPVPLKGTRRDVPESAANARLMAAAPELLAALKSLVQLMGDASDAGALYGKHDIAWMKALDGIRFLIERTERTVE
jgi:hypothetical protein